MLGKVDSINLTLQNNKMDFILKDNENYTKEPIKDFGTFEPNRWLQFGKPLTKNIKRAYILHSFNGAELPIKSYSRCQDKEVIEFAGLEDYKERGELLKAVFDDLYLKLLNAQIQRVDICMDFEKVPNAVIKNLTKSRLAFKYKNTTYFKTKKERKSNNFYDVKIYDKSKKAKLSCELYRLEFCFKLSYIKKAKLEDIKTLFIKMEKTIKTATGLKIKIEDLK